MKLLSIDVGIKNLAYCLLETAPAAPLDQVKILKWDVINLCGPTPTCSACTKTAKFAQTSVFYCAAHAKKSGLLLPTGNISQKKIKKMKLSDLQQVITEYSIPSAATKKDDVLRDVLSFIEQKMLISVATAKANDMDLIQIGIAMRKAFDQELKDHLSSLTHIVIKIIGAAIAAFFINILVDMFGRTAAIAKATATGIS